jgi:drug/metabolite transporter (DMT)-like permease
MEEPRRIPGGWHTQFVLLAATCASTVTYLIPVFSTVLGVVVLGETLRWNEPVGAAVLIAGIAIAQERLRR